MKLCSLWIDTDKKWAFVRLYMPRVPLLLMKRSLSARYWETNKYKIATLGKPFTSFKEVLNLPCPPITQIKWDQYRRQGKNPATATREETDKATKQDEDGMSIKKVRGKKVAKVTRKERRS